MEYQKKQYKEYELPESAVEFLNFVSSISQKSMSEYIRKTEKSNLISTTYLPVDLDINTIEDSYEGGGLTGRKYPVNWLVQRIKEFLLLGSNKFILFEDALSSKGEPWMNGKSYRPFNFLDQEIYYSLYPKDVENDKLIEEIINCSPACNYGIGIMTSMPENLLPLPQELDEDIFQLIMKNTEHIISLTFDGEGYIIYTFAE